MNDNFHFNTKYVLAGYEIDKYGPHLVLDTVAAAPCQRVKFTIQEQTFTLERFRGRYCIGRTDIASLSSTCCPLHAPLTGANPRCQECFQATGFNPAFYHVPPEELSPQQQAYNEQPHDVYLAHFGGDTFKVGIANHRRIVTRWREQGAITARVIQECRNAYEARDLEAAVRSRLQVAEAVMSATKRQLLQEPYDAEKARLDMDALCNRISEELSLTIPRNDILDLRQDYFGNYRLEPPLIDVSDEQPLYISGKGVGMIGDTLIVEQAKRQFMVSVKFFLSHIVRFLNEVKPHHTVPGQMNLL